MSFSHALATLWLKTKRRIPTTCVLSIRIFFVFMFVCLTDAFAQSRNDPEAAARLTEVKPISKGDTVPEEVWNMPFQLVSPGQQPKTIRLSDYRGKVIILDYWATWCTGCINAMPLMHELAHAYPDDIVLLPVTYEGTALITNFLEKTTSEPMKQVLASFTSIVDGQVLKDLIPHRTIPHIAVINGDGVLEQETMPHMLNIEILGNIITREAYDIPEYYGEMKTPILSPTYPDVEKEKPYYYSMVSGYLNGFENRFTQGVDSTAGVQYGRYVNRALLVLYIAALRPGFSILMPNRRIMLVKDPKAIEYFRQRNPDYNRFTSHFCYEYAWPLSWSEAQVRERMQRDLQDITGFYATIVPVEVPCLVLKTKDSLLPESERTPLSGLIVEGVQVGPRVPEYVGSSASGAKNHLTGLNISNLVSYMNNAKQGAVPFMIDETGMHHGIDLDLPDDLYDVDRMEAVLSRQGIQLVREMRTIEMFVMSEEPIGSLPNLADLELTKYGYVLRKEAGHE